MSVVVVKRLKREEKSSVNELRKPFHKLPAAKTSDTNDISHKIGKTKLKIESILFGNFNLFKRF